MKPVIYDNKEQNQQLISHAASLFIRTEGEETLVPLSNILYISSEKRLVLFYLRQGERKCYQCYETLCALTEKLEPKGFLRVQKSFLVNMQQIHKMDRLFVTLSDGTQLPISRQRSRELIRTYLQWKNCL